MAKQIRHILLESATIQEAVKFFDECISKYFPTLKSLPKPKFVVFYDTRRSGLYKIEYDADGNLKEEEIKVNRDLFNYPEKLKSVVWHETIHYAEEHLKPRSHRRGYSRALSSLIDHSGFFAEQMKHINDREGYELITVKDEYAQGQESASEFYVHMFRYPRGGNHTYVFWTAKNNQATQEFVQNMLKRSNATHYYTFPSKVVAFKLTPKMVPSSKYFGGGFWEDIEKKIEPELARELEKKLEQGKFE